MENSKLWISKSNYSYARRCGKLAYLATHHRQLRAESKFGESMIRKSQLIKHTAYGLSPGGVDISEQQLEKFEDKVDFTHRLLEQENVIIYQGCFRSPSSNKQCRIDIVERQGNKLKITEVLSRTKMDDQALLEMAFAYRVISECYPNLKIETRLIYLNSDYVRQDQLELEQLFMIQYVSHRMKLMQSLVDRYSRIAEKTMSMNKMPNVNIGTQCSKPYDCLFKEYCWKDIPSESVFDLSRAWEIKKFKLFDQGIVQLKDIPRQVKLTEKQWMQVDCSVQNRQVIDRIAIHNFISELPYPIYFMDFETFQPPIPLYKGTSPYTQVPFQFSVHCQQSQKGQLTHVEYLSNGKGDPRLPFLQNLLEALGSTGTILVYNQKFEETRLKELAKAFPEYEAVILKVIARMKDLMIPFEERYLYHPTQKGSSSLKKVLPAWVPELSYEGLSIGNGVAASDQFEKLTQPYTSTKEKQQIKRDLLEYCKLDTYAMVRLLQVLQQLSQGYGQKPAA